MIRLVENTSSFCSLQAVERPSLVAERARTDGQDRHAAQEQGNSSSRDCDPPDRGGFYREFFKLKECAVAHGDKPTSV
jgi:hypothetical protein